jgi:hypothetical protein
MDEDIPLYTSEDFSRQRSLFWRLPPILKVFVFFMFAAIGLVFGAVLWLVIGALTM